LDPSALLTAVAVRPDTHDIIGRQASSSAGEHWHLTVRIRDHSLGLWAAFARERGSWVLFHTTIPPAHCVTHPSLSSVRVGKDVRGNACGQEAGVSVRVCACVCVFLCVCACVRACCRSPSLLASSFRREPILECLKKPRFQNSSKRPRARKAINQMR
jgi:hypothetical protein